MHSMTGFGRNETDENGHKVNIEVKSVNHRFLDINIRMPRFLYFLEEELRKVIKQRLVRGRVDVFVNYTSLASESKTVRVDIPLVQAYLKAIGEIEASTGVKNDMTMENIVRLPDVIVFEESEAQEDELRLLLTRSLNGALDQLIAARETEGIRISKDIFERLALLSETVDQIESREPDIINEYREKLKQRLTEYLESTEIDENRFNAEIVYFMDRSNITEEIVRLRSHIKQCRETLGMQAASGRNMDFIIQEMNREFNTIGSKSSDIGITKAVLFAKGEVEKIREQVQNIE